MNVNSEKALKIREPDISYGNRSGNIPPRIK